MNEQKSLIYRLAETYEHYRAERRASAPEQDARPRQSGRLCGLLRWFVPNGGTLLLVAALILTQQVWARPLLSPASAPGPSATTVNYQGRLADHSGNPLNGTYGMTFSLWDAATGGNLVWGPESHAAVPVSQGLFSVGLGSQTSGGIPTTVWNGDRYLQITVGGETLAPRELIRSIPIAGMALTVPDGAITSAMIQDGSLSPADYTAFASEARDFTDRGTTSSSFVDFGSTNLNLNLPYRAIVYAYLRGALQNPDGNCMLTVAIDGVDQFGNASIYLETINTTWRTAGTGAILIMEPGNHAIRPRFGNLYANGTTCTAGQVAYGYVVLGRAP